MKRGMISQLRWTRTDTPPRAVAEAFALAPSADPPQPPAPPAATATERALDLYGLPEVAVTPADTARGLLRAAAEIEHGLLVQYLYALYSLAGPPVPPAWAGTIKSIAVQEMDHLITVQNLLLALKNTDLRPYFDRANFPVPADRVGFYPFPFRLEPVSADSLAKYVSAESPLPESVRDDALRAELEAVIARAEAVAGVQMFGHVGNLYAYLYWLFLPSDDAVTRYWPDFPNAWFQRHRPGFHVRPEDFADPARLEQFQVRANEVAALDGNAANYPNNDNQTHRWVFTVRNADDALRAIAQIAIQGEGLDTASDSHFLEFLGVYRAVVAFNGSVHRAVTADPHLRPNPNVPAGRITNPVTRLWAELCNTRYLMLLQELPLALSLSRTDAAQSEARRVLFMTAIQGEMRVGIKALAMKLMTLPLGDDPALLAGPPFELPDAHLPATADDQWRELVRLIGETDRLLAQLRALTGADKPSADDERHLHALETNDQQVLQIVPTPFRPQPVTPREPAPVAVLLLNSFDDVKAFLNQFIATNGTDLSGSPHGAFWETDYDSFVNGNVPGTHGVKILVKGDPDNSNLIKILKGPLTVNGRTFAQMPADGSPFMSPAQIAALANWIKNNCPK